MRDIFNDKSLKTYCCDCKELVAMPHQCRGVRVIVIKPSRGVGL